MTRPPLRLLLLVLLLCGVTVAPAQAATPAGVTITGVDLHDGTMIQAGGQYVLYGTEYGCGFSYGTPSAPWCGFGVSTAPSPAGPWSPPRLLFSPNARSPFTGGTFQALCGGTGAGCYNPRMIQRSGWGPNDGVWILWFNAPADNRSGANGYYAMGCNSPLGPCGAEAGAPYGSTTKPSLYRCGGNGDESVVYDNPRNPFLFCTNSDQTLSQERLSMWGTTGTGEGAARLAGAVSTEGPGAYRDPSGTWVLTLNETNCAYCGGTGTSYATATSAAGPWTMPTTPTVGGGVSGHRMISGTSCGGQGRTVTTLDGQPYQFIDLWLGTRNEARAGIRLEPLTYRGPTPAGTVWSPFTPWTC